MDGKNAFTLVGVAVLFVFLLVALLGVQGFYLRKAREDLQSFLTENPNPQISIDGKIVQHPALLLEALRTPLLVAGNHSSPTNKLRLVLRGRAGELDLYLGRDSKNRREYWLFSPRYRATDYGSADFARIRTAALDAY